MCKIVLRHNALGFVRTISIELYILWNEKADQKISIKYLEHTMVEE